MKIKILLIEDQVKQMPLTASGIGFLGFLWRWYSSKILFKDFVMPYCPIDVKEWKIKEVNWND